MTKYDERERRKYNMTLRVLNISHWHVKKLPGVP